MGSTVYMTTGMKLPISLLHQKGLVSGLFSSEEEANKLLQELLREISTAAPGAIAQTKANIQYCAAHSGQENEKHVKEVFANTVHSEEAMHGIACFAQKKKPDWCSPPSSRL